MPDPQHETNLVRAIRKKLERRGFWVVKLADRYRRGLPDLLAIGELDGELAVLALEVKRPGGRPTLLQQLELSRLDLLSRKLRAGRLIASVVDSSSAVDDLLQPRSERALDQVRHVEPVAGGDGPRASQESGRQTDRRRHVAPTPRARPPRPTIF